MKKSIHSAEYACVLRLLKEMRKKQKITQTELGNQLGQTQSYVSKIEGGELRVDVIQLRSICQALGSELSAFVGKLERELGRGKRT